MYFGDGVKDIKVELITVIDELTDIKRMNSIKERTSACDVNIHLDVNVSAYFFSPMNK